MGRGDDVAHCRLNRRTPDPSFECSSKARAPSPKIIYSNPKATLCVRSKQPRTIKTIIYNDIFTSLRGKKVQYPAKQLKELLGLVCYFFALN